MTPAAFIDDPNWANFIPEFRDGASKRHLPLHEDCQQIIPEDIASCLEPGGVLGNFEQYEKRPGQIDMLKAIARAFNNREHLMIEAGTGVGKSLAYLLPSVAWAMLNDTPVVISTATRNLQSQLINSDIPRAITMLGENAAKFKVALLKGRSNYLCLRAVADFFAPGFWTMSDEEQAEMPHFIQWLKSTVDGDLDRYNGLPRAILTTPGEECSARRCPYFSRCFVYRARKNAAEAHLIVANHALVIAEAVNGNGAILPAYARIVFDEAHNLEDVATDYLSSEFSIAALMRVLNRLSRKGSARRKNQTGLVFNVARFFQRINSKSYSSVADEFISAVPKKVARILKLADEIIALPERLLRHVKGAEMIRFKVLNNTRCYSVRGVFNACDKELWDEEIFRKSSDKLEQAIASLVQLLHITRDSLDEFVEEAKQESFIAADLSQQISGVADSLISFVNAMTFIFKAEKTTHAYWVERLRENNIRSQIRVVAAPLSVAEHLNALFYATKDSVVLSSATLRVGNDFRYMSRRLGCNLSETESSSFRALTATSPFDYLRQALVLAPDCLPDPAQEMPSYVKEFSLFLRKLFAAVDARALVLFTSYEMMQDVAEVLRSSPMSFQLLVQGEGLSREAMTDALKCARAPTVLFGSQSFWEGVDISGDALTCVVIARLPFASVGDAIVEARSEHIARNGGSAFRDYALPEAVIKFRQGFGRLIRSRRDRGVVIVADPRIVTKNYGATFRKSIPASVHTAPEIDELVQRAQEFLSDESL